MNRSLSFSSRVFPTLMLMIGKPILSTITTTHLLSRFNGSGALFVLSTKRNVRNCYNLWRERARFLSMASKNSKAWTESIDSIFIETLATRAVFRLRILASTVSIYTLHKIKDSRLTCYTELDIPEYESYDGLRSQFHKAITAGSEYFGFA